MNYNKIDRVEFDFRCCCGPFLVLFFRSRVTYSTRDISCYSSILTLDVHLFDGVAVKRAASVSGLGKVASTLFRSNVAKLVDHCFDGGLLLLFLGTHVALR